VVVKLAIVARATGHGKSPPVPAKALAS